MGKYFGTDGVRGIANTELDSDKAYRMGRALACELYKALGRKPRVAIGRDTRISGSMLECALAAGICACGGDVYLLGVMPTPSVAYLTKEGDLDAGAVISASHNPFEHNGIKVFGGDGYKFDDEREERMEALMDSLPEGAMKTGADVGQVYDKSAEGAEKYESFIISCAGESLRPMKVMFDCANGASYKTAGKIFSALGLDCVFMSCSPDGININDMCGSTHMEELCRRVKEEGCDLGVAFDGDADRCLFCDENGNVIDGDDTLALLGTYMKKQGKLRGNVVATIMSNMGLASYLKPYGIEVTATKVGDRHVLEEMRRSGSNIGGEQSGHVILSDYATTGDGQLTALKFIEMLSSEDVKASQLASGIFHFPQVIKGVRVSNAVKKQVAGHRLIAEMEKKASEAFKGEGRINIRPSGTEALVRVMAEGRDKALVERIAGEACEAVEAAAKDLEGR